MRAAFVHRNCILRDSDLDPRADPESWQLVPATIEAMRLLGQTGDFVFLYGSCPPDPGDGERDDCGFDRLVEQIEAAGGRVDATIVCPHGEGEYCRCWGEFPGILWVAAYQFDLQLGECYVLCDTLRDLVTAKEAGARPMLILGQRAVADVLGEDYEHRDAAMAPDLTTAKGYIDVEDEIGAQVGHAREDVGALPTEADLYENRAALPRLRVHSRYAGERQARLVRTRLERREIGRWLIFFTLGAIGLSLGIAYILTHLYRQQPFPAFVYYLTLQFIPRAVRGLLFVAWGVLVIGLATRSFIRATNILGDGGE